MNATNITLIAVLAVLALYAFAIYNTDDQNAPQDVSAESPS
jgi:uncharacterized membrane protein YsdA (DUF1294 family)